MHRCAAYILITDETRSNAVHTPDAAHNSHQWQMSIGGRTADTSNHNKLNARSNVSPNKEQCGVVAAAAAAVVVYVVHIYICTNRRFCNRN